MELESELGKTVKENRERRELLDDVLKEIALFNLKQDETNINEENESVSQANPDSPQDLDTTMLSLFPPGIQFFTGNFNCIYDQESLLWCTNTEVLTLDDLKFLTSLPYTDRMVWLEHNLKDITLKKSVFEHFFKILFTAQSTHDLEVSLSILIRVVNITNQVNDMVKMVLDYLPTGFANLGGEVPRVCSKEILSSLPEKRENISAEGKTHNPLINLKYILKILKHVITKQEHKNLRTHLSLNIMLDDVVLLLLVASQDPLVLSSTIVPIITNLLASILDLYPSDSNYSEKVQDIVERLGIYWDTFQENFNHQISGYVICDVIPITRRGRHLRASLAYYSIMCCLSLDEVEVLDIVHLSTLSKFLCDNVEAIKNVSLTERYSIYKLVDAAIERPIMREKDKECLEVILKMIDSLQLSIDNQADCYSKTRLEAFVKRIKVRVEQIFGSTLSETKNFLKIKAEAYVLLHSSKIFISSRISSQIS